MDINNNDINGLNITPNMNYVNNTFSSPNKRFNTEYTYNNSININNISNNNKNLYTNKELDDLFEKISLLLKDYYNNDNLYFKNIKLIS